MEPGANRQRDSAAAANGGLGCKHPAFSGRTGVKKNGRTIDRQTLEIFRQSLARLAWESSTRALFPEPLTLHFAPPQTHCPQCRQPLKVCKTRGKSVATLHLGRYAARETLLHCETCKTPRVYGSPDLASLVSSGCTFGYDVLVRVGQALFLRHRSVAETIEELFAANLRISPSEVEYLGKKFIVYLALAHQESVGRLRAIMRAKGGYILHLDGTCDQRGPVLMSGLDSISEIVLGNVKLPSEKTEEIIPFLRQIKQRFGTPLAAVHDMGRGILRAIQTVFPHIPDFICHFHFLRDLGADLFGNPYDRVRAALRRHGIGAKLRYHAKRLKTLIDQQPQWMDAFDQSFQTGVPPSDDPQAIPLISAYSLIQWALQARQPRQGYGFPFDRPHVTFAQRLRALHSQIQSLTPPLPLGRLGGKLQAVCDDPELTQALEQIEPKMKVFDQLRDAMHIAPTDQPEGLNSGSADLPMGPIEKAVRQFRRQITSAPGYAANEAHRKMIAQIDAYWKKLFANPITVKTSSGIVSIQPQRTNNLLERFFRDFR
ncbi:MAG: transposase, partial [Chloroflexota bacterium]